jgi:preprotein translocase subunit YajC
MGLEWIISIIGMVVIIYFMIKPKTKQKSKDKLTKEIKVKGLNPPCCGDDWVPRL